MIFSTKPDRQETALGIIYIIIDLFVLPGLLTSLHTVLGSPLSAGQLNFLFFCANFIAVAVIFRRFWAQSIRDALTVPFHTIWYAVLGYLGNTLVGRIVAVICLSLYPGFANVNDSSIAVMLSQDFALVAFGTVVLVPIAEEALYRGVIFRNLFDRNPVLAYAVSMVVFSAIHVLGYIGSYEPLVLLLCFIQYLPAGYCLAFCYHCGGNILCPIFMHMLTNIAAIAAMR